MPRDKVRRMAIFIREASECYSKFSANLGGLLALQCRQQHLFSQWFPNAFATCTPTSLSSSSSSSSSSS
eukprot:2903934-Karenia_brevis.AAC.1